MIPEISIGPNQGRKGSHTFSISGFLPLLILGMMNFNGRAKSRPTRVTVHVPRVSVSDLLDTIIARLIVTLA